MDYTDLYKRFQHIPEISCIYGIAVLINKMYQVVYIGKTKNWQHRTACHYKAILNDKGMKYKLLRDFRANDYPIITFCLEETSDIDAREAYYINYYMPPLNTQIPDLDNPKKYWCKKLPNSIDEIDCKLKMELFPMKYPYPYRRYHFFV